MASAPESAAESHHVDTALEFYSDLLGAVAEVVGDTADLLEHRFATVERGEDFVQVRGMVRGVRERAVVVATAAVKAEQRVEALRAEWHAARRWTDDGLAELLQELNGLRNEPAAAAQRWLSELFDALDAQEWDAVLKIAAFKLDWPERLRGAAERIARDLRTWNDDDPDAGLTLMTALDPPDGSDPRESKMKRWAEVLSPRLRARAHRLAAWIALRQLDDADAALSHLDQAVDLYPYGGRMHAERAAYFLNLPDFDRAATDAQHAIERAGDGGNGFLELGIWAELTGEFEAGDDFYRRGLARMPSFEIARLITRAALIDPPGRLLGRAAEKLHERGRDQVALELCDWALVAHVRGAEPHAKAFVHRLRSELLESLHPDAPKCAAAEALAAGELFMWNGQLDQAVGQLRRARDLDPALPTARWLLADALTSQSLPPGEVVPNQEILENARDTWDRQRDAPKQENGGPPAGETSWAYLTRAIISDLSTQGPDEDRERGIWNAVALVEQALLHDDSDAQRWAFAAQYLRYAGLNDLAAEAMERGRQIKPDDRRLLVERLVTLAMAGPVAQAEEVADELVATYGQDPQVSALSAHIAMRRSRWEEAMALLELPFEEGNDKTWYLDMHARCHIALGHPREARADYREMVHSKEEGLVPAAGGTGKCRLAGAAAIVRLRAKAERWLQLAAEDATAPAFDRAKAEAWLELARDDRRAAASALERAALTAPSVAELDDLKAELRLRRRLMAGGEPQRAGGLERAVAAARPVRMEQLEQLNQPRRAARQMEEALGWVAANRWGDDDLAPTALLAVAGRRHLTKGKWQEAASCYRRIRALGARFEPEATLGLARAIRFESEEHAEAGRATEVAELQRQLEELGVDTPVDSALALATAYAVDGKRREAIALLREQLGAAADDAERHALYRRVGRLHMDLGNLTAARKELMAARRLAYARKRFDGAARLEIMLAVIGLNKPDGAEVKRRLDAAAKALGGTTGAEDIVAREFVQLGAGYAPVRRFNRAPGDPIAAARTWAKHRRRRDLEAELAKLGDAMSSGDARTIR